MYHLHLLVGDVVATREKVSVMPLNGTLQLQVVQILLLSKCSPGNILGAVMNVIVYNGVDKTIPSWLLLGGAAG
jgi:hypothetical protein